MCNMMADRISHLSLLMMLLIIGATEGQGQAPPNTELYFILNGTVYLPGDTILITDIGNDTTNDRSDPGSSLVCVTANVNIHCCNSADNPNGGSRGEWYLPNGTMLLNTPDTNFYRTRYTQQIRLNRKNNAISPTGVFTCEVPNDGDSTMNHTANITITPIYFTLNGTVYRPGDTILITDIGSENTNNMSDPGSSLVCDTTNVNTQYCIDADGEDEGEWLDPDGTIILNGTTDNFYITCYTHQIRLNRRNDTMSPTGVFTCEVPNDADDMMLHTATITIDPLLNVMLNGSGGTLTAGQNHMLTCEASGGGSMEYIYTWLKNSNRVSGQTSSTYSFSPLLVVHSGRYSCRVSVGSMTMTSEGVDITVQTNVTQLYFTWRGNIYEPGDSILIADIGWHHGDTGPGDSLVCVTTDVNTQCCNNRGVGEWFFPNGSMVLHDTVSQVARTGHANQVRLNFVDHQESPTGEYTCVVPETGGSVIQTAGIKLVTVLPQLNVTLQGDGTLMAGQNHTLTCIASGGGSMAYTYTWLKDGSVVSGQTSSTYSFSPLLAVLFGRYSCNVSVGSTTVTSEGVNITVVGTTTQLYFTWRGNRYEPGDSILITDVIVHHGDAGPGDSLVCVATDVNTQCCTDRGGVGEWFFPNGSMVLRNIDDPNRNSQIIRTGRANQVRLNFRKRRTSPTGEYTCVVPETGGSVIQTAGIRLVSDLPQMNVVLTGSGGILTEGQNHTLTCEASGGGSMAYTYMWLKDGSVVSDQTSSTYSFSPLSETDSGGYSCQVRVGSTTMNTSREVKITVVDKGLPRHPESVIVTSTTPTGVTIQWMLTEPFNATQPETFVVSYGTTQNELTRISTSMVIATATSQTYSIQLNSLDIGTQYYFQVQSRNKFESVVSNVMNFMTDDTMSGPVGDLQTNSPDNSTLVISWRPPTTPNGNIISYTVRIDNLRDGTTLNIMNHSANLTKNDLIAGVPYRVSVAAVNRAGQGSVTKLTNFTKELEPSISPRNVSITRTSPTVMVVSWIPLTLSEARGFITSYTVLYSPQVSRRKRQEPNTMQKTVNGDVNQTTIDGLDANTIYDVQMSASTKAGASALSEVISAPMISAPVPDTGDGRRGGAGGGVGEGVVVGVAVGLLIAVLLGVVIVIVIIIFIRCGKGVKSSTEDSIYLSKDTPQAIPLKEKEVKQKDKSIEVKEEEAMEQYYENTTFMVQERQKPVPVDKFPQHVHRMHSDRDKQFELEYNSIERSPQADYDAAVIPKNKARNRFGNIFPYDFNRVVLESKPGDDYINASYIDGYKRRRVYIGSQGPTDNSLEDFWRMIWEQRVPTIIMLTRIFEGRKKCEEYWPENGDTPFVPAPDSPLSVQYDSVLPFPEFTIRKMTVTNSDEPGTPPFTVTLYHYLGWPDHGVPANAFSMINFVKRVRKSHPYSKEDLLLVHCSAGVGRTGTFITLDSMLERINVEKSINILEFVSNLRKQRVLMVQTLVQYMFIHDALNELLTCGETEIAAANMRIAIGRLSKPVNTKGMTGFSKQFQTLESMSDEGLSLSNSNATSEPNMSKNRYENVLPYNHMRVRLKSLAVHGSDYINASFIEGYRHKGAYIATQGPLPHTVNNFWRMIWEQEVKCIVMLCQTEEKGKEVCHRYWPLGRGSSETFGKYLVTLTSQENKDDYIIRKMDICENQSRDSISPSSFTITQIQYVKWPEDSVPQETTAVLEIANLVQKVQIMSGNKAIVVMCNNGIGRSGAFICMHSQMERMKAEAMVDIFQFIKAVRIQRAGLVTTQELYEFCHHVLADFLDGFDTYANFKEII